MSNLHSLYAQLLEAEMVCPDCGSGLTFYPCGDPQTTESFGTVELESNHTCGYGPLKIVKSMNEVKKELGIA